MRTALILPTRNAGAHLDRLLPALAIQSLKPDEFLVIDSQSSDDTVARLRAFGARVEVIPVTTFNHGGTRRLASEMVEADILFFLTQDAIPAHPEALENLLKELLSNPDNGMAYGRQLPHPGAGALESHARHFNYSATSRSKCLADAAQLGIKTCFCSDSFSAYKRTALATVDGFPQDVIACEDTYVAGRMLLSGLRVQYAASAQVYHSHAYTLHEEFKRYFDTGVFYGREHWIGEAFGQASGEGLRFVLSECRMLLASKMPLKIPSSFLRTLCKLLGYRLGRCENSLPLAVKRRISLHTGYWKNT